MEGEKRFLVVALCLGVLCVTVLSVFMFISLWQYRGFVGLSLFLVLLAAAWVFLRGRLNEQDLRVIRFRHHEETPLDDHGEPVYWHHGYQANPHRK